MRHPLRVYGDGLRAGSAAGLRFADGSSARIPLERYLAPADAVDRLLLSGVAGPVLDVGCGPGRHLSALAACGVFGLGVDLSPVAVQLATRCGALAVVASIFDDLPGAGSWRTALLLDGNIGIGGAPGRLLRRIRALLRDDGELLVELDPPGVPTGATLVQIESAHGTSSWFPWARVAEPNVAPLAHAAGFAVAERRSIDGRRFARLVARPAAGRATRERTA